MAEKFQEVSAETMNKGILDKVANSGASCPKPVKFQCALKQAGLDKPRNLVVNCSTIGAAKKYVKENLDNIQSFQIVTAETMNKDIKAPADPMKPKKIACKVLFKDGQMKNVVTSDKIKLQKYINENFEQIQSWEVK